MEFYTQPAATDNSGNPQETAPASNGSTNAIFTNNLTNVAANSTAKSQIINVGNLIRGIIFVARNSSGVRDETDWPAVSTLYLNDNQELYLDKDIWNADMADAYNLGAGKTAAPTRGALDQGVFVIFQYMQSGQPGSGKVDGSSDRRRWLPTATDALLELESTSGWGSGISTVQASVNMIKPSSVQSLYTPELY
jgi:hypothetical protein